MKVRLLRLFAGAWALGFLALLVLSVGRQVFAVAPTAGEGINEVLAWFDPSRARTYVAPLVMLSPAAAALYLSHRLRRR